MRRILAGPLAVALLLLSCTAALAQQDEVESIGFNNHYRPDCWTPMVVRITPEKSGTYQLQVIQGDLDGDEPIYVQDITLTGAEEGKGSQQRFWMYFIPQPTQGGLYDVSRGGSIKELQSQLRVYLAHPNGKQIKQLPITSTIINLEPKDMNPFAQNPRGTKLILAIGDGRSKLLSTEYEKAMGVMETVVMVPLQSRDLPEDPRGFDAVDAIVWTNTEAPDASSPTAERRMRALQKWVRGGGKLVICQPPERDRTLPWGDMLPVVVNSIEDKKDLMPLAALAMPRANQTPQQTPIVEEIRRAWVRPTGPFRVARADAKEGTVVETWIEWDPVNNKKDRTPYLVRMPYGLGLITWVAQDLGDPAIVNRGASVGWPNVWNRIFGWNDSALVRTNTTTEPQREPWDGGMGIDLYPSMMSGATLEGKSQAFIGLAIIFFVVYWLIAGPGLYLYLVAKARAYMSWFTFAAAAIAATAVTVLVVQLVVRGDPELAHVSVVRKAHGDPAVVISRFGLYIPQDGPQDVRLRDTDPAGDSYITAMAAHPKHIREDASLLSFKNYNVPVHQSGSGEPVQVAFPYRSTQRQLQARWVGIMNNAVEGAGKIVHANDGYIEGTLTNGTGRQLRNVYIAFHHPTYLQGNDCIMYLPTWEKGYSIDLRQEFNSNVKFVSPKRGLTPANGLPERNEKVIGTLARHDDQWPGYWYEDIRNNGIGAETLDDYKSAVKKSFPMLSFFSRLPPVRNPQRVEVLRRGQRQFDVGHALAAGQLVVLAEAPNSPLPFNLEVEGDRVMGTGTTYYQFVLPMDRTAKIVDEEQDQQQQQQQPNPALERADTSAAPKPGSGLRRIPPRPQQPPQPLLTPVE